LIKNNLLELATFGLSSTHDLILHEFHPDKFIVLNMLESMQCDLQIVMFLGRKASCEFQWEFQYLMDRAKKAMEHPNSCERSLQGCQFLHDHYSELEDDVKEALALALKDPKVQIVKQKFFNDLGL
jgi:hypothetical protein